MATILNLRLSPISLAVREYIQELHLRRLWKEACEQAVLEYEAPATGLSQFLAD